MQGLFEQPWRNHDTLLGQQAGQDLWPAFIGLAPVERTAELHTFRQTLDLRRHATGATRQPGHAAHYQYRSSNSRKYTHHHHSLVQTPGNRTPGLAVDHRMPRRSGIALSGSRLLSIERTGDRKSV